MVEDNQNGFVAITSSIIISALLLILVVSSSLSSFFSLANLLESLSKQQSQGLASGCVSMVALRLENDKNFSGGQNLPLSENFCQISTVNNESGVYVFESKAKKAEAFTTLRANLSIETLNITGLIEK